MQHQRRTSDFGGFVSAAPSSSTQSSNHIRLTREPILHTNDLLGSFDDEEDIRPPNGKSINSLQPLIPPPYASTSSARPMMIHLPPRPDEMPADYIPPLHSPRRMSQPYIVAGPSSPPAVNPERIRRSFDDRSKNADAGPSKLANILSPTVKAANKWRRSTDRHLNDEKSSSSDLFEDWPALVTHDNPFIPAEPHPIFHLPPSGAPGFINAPEPKISHSTAELPPPVLELAGRRMGTSPVLDQAIGLSLLRHIPARQRLSKTWSLIFSLDQHGASLSSLYRHAEAASAKGQGFGCILIIEDGDGRKFGAFLNENIVRREGSYYGSGESFLFKIPPSSGPQTPPPVYRWTGKNQYFSLCESSFVSFGGGSGTYGLMFDSTFSKCSSATCPTYDNEVLCSPTPRHSDKATYFDCVGLEVWATMAL